MFKAKRILALALCVLLALTMLTGCHAKGEIAVSVGDWDFTSGYYACALVTADMQARTLVDEQLTEDGESLEDIDYYKHEVEDTDYTEWVKTYAIDNLKLIAAYKSLCVENEITLDDDTKALAKSYSDYLWDSYGYSVLFEANGVSKATFYQYNEDAYFADKYFEFVYGKGGEKEIAAEELSKELSENYVIANVLEVDFTSLEEDEIQSKTAQFQQYEEDLNKGSRSFEQIYLEYNNINEEEHSHESEDSDELSPKDPHATILGDEGTDYASENFKDAKAMQTGEVKLITLEDEAGLVLLVKQDIAADPYYIDFLDTSLRSAIAGEELEKETSKYAEKLEFSENTFATKQFKVKKIVYPEAQQ